MREQLVLLGGKIKTLRKAAKMTLQTLAEQTGLTAGLLSKIENFRTIPSLPVLMSIATALEVDLSELFAGMSFRGKTDWLLIRSSEQRMVEREDDNRGVSYTLILEKPLDAVNLQVMLVTIDPGVQREAVSGDGDEMLYILSGKVDYLLGSETVSLEAGDTLFFDGVIPHAPVNTGEKTVTLLACYFLKENNS